MSAIRKPTSDELQAEITACISDCASKEDKWRKAVHQVGLMPAPLRVGNEEEYARRVKAMNDAKAEAEKSAEMLAIAEQTKTFHEWDQNTDGGSDALSKYQTEESVRLEAQWNN